jgi:hypothetical protein
MMNRRVFFQSSLRIGILAGMTGGVLFLIKEKRVDYTCSADEVCKSCSKYTGCDLDKAKQNRTGVAPRNFGASRQ